MGIRQVTSWAAVLYMHDSRAKDVTIEGPVKTGCWLDWARRASGGRCVPQSGLGVAPATGSELCPAVPGQNFLRGWNPYQEACEDVMVGGKLQCAGGFKMDLTGRCT